MADIINLANRERTEVPPWWAIKPGHEAAYRAVNRAFAVHFGERFASAFAENFWIGPSPDGALIGFKFVLNNGETAWAAIPTDAFVAFLTNLMRTAVSCTELQKPQQPPAGEAELTEEILREFGLVPSTRPVP